jgi:hypothetical protein
MAIKDNMIATIMLVEEFVPWDNYIEMDNIMLESYIISQLLIVVNVVKKTASFFKIQVLFQIDVLTKMIIAKVSTLLNFALKQNLNLNVQEKDQERLTDIYIVNGMLISLRWYSMIDTKRITMRIMSMKSLINWPFG